MGGIVLCCPFSENEMGEATVNLEPGTGQSFRVLHGITAPTSPDQAAGLPEDAIIGRLSRRDGSLDPIGCGQLLAAGNESATAAVADALRCCQVPDRDLLPRADGVLRTILASPVRLTGAETVAVLLGAAGVSHVFAYAGTSELPLCDAVANTPGITLLNGRGDKESAFMAAGGSLLRANRAAAILHGARGLTNAAGGLADARRNEAGTVFVVGLPSTGSARFLPPHAESRLIEITGNFARWSWESPAVPTDPSALHEAAVTYVRRMREAIATAGRRPWGPVLFGVPQDVAEDRWIPLNAFTAAGPAHRAATDVEPAAVELLRAAARPVLLVDDYALRGSGIRQALERISQTVGAAVLQLRYRRGPMLFERLQTSEVTNFVGWLNQYSTAHMELLNDADLLITVEDRNIYRRVVGDLPTCRKMAINTDRSKVIKNEYLAADDILIDGEPAEVLNQLADRLGTDRPAHAWFSDYVQEDNTVTPEPPSDLVRYGRHQVATTVADLLAGWTNPVLVDDSQMFGGLISEDYDELPAGLRVFGGHGGFVGGGLAYAIGLAVTEPGVRVLCTLGDQAFTNSFQALVAAIQQEVPLLVLVCNNGGSVSLKKQANASYGAQRRDYLANVRGFSYYGVAQALGVPAERVEVPIGASPEVIDFAAGQLAAALARGAAINRPALVEVVLPANPEVWRGIWLTQGFEQVRAVNVG